MYRKTVIFIVLTLFQSLTAQIQAYKDGLLYGIKDLKGNNLILPIFSEVKRYGEDNYAVKANGKWGLINYAGKYIAGCAYDGITPYKEGLSRVKFDDLYGFLDKFGTPVTKTIYSKAFNFESGFARVQLKDKWGIINKNGTYTIRPMFDSISRSVNKITLVKLNKKYGLLGDKLQSISPIQYTKYKWFSSAHIALYDQNSSVTLYNTNGKLIETLNDSEIMTFSNNSIRVKNDDLWGIINFDGSWLLPPTFKEIGPLHDQMARIKDNNLYGFINHKTEIVFPPQYPNASDFSKGLARIQIGSSWKWIDTQGKVILTDDDVKVTSPEAQSIIKLQAPQIDPNAEFETLDNLEKIQMKNDQVQRAAEIIYYNNYPGYFYRPYYRQRFINNCRPIISYLSNDWNIYAGGCGIRATYNKPLHFTIKF